MPNSCAGRAVSLFCLVWVVMPLEKCDFFVYGMKTVVNIMSAEMQLVGSIGAEIEIGSYAEVVNAVPG